ncbi:GNAT family N-acetyltransferase [Bacillus sp. BRMEA1]|uniref:GNAT family N-acetyltransferase n=1 Tax=Neobacillus endophyticus TaxID=2738405 RepID=UPI001563B2E5|nr:GNAT family protein [Neobacillus endophyticus]NRD79518.1 GNAT family N-acetyltransferase [Neobacillus endophyticus]
MEKFSADKDGVSLEFYHSIDRPLFEGYFLLEDQKRFTAHPSKAIAICEMETDRFPIKILHNRQLAGFFVLHGWKGVKEYSSNRQALLLRAYSVDMLFQGKGIAQKSLQLLPEFVQINFPLVNEIILAVNEDNIRAQHVYKKCGFTDHGVRAMGRTGPMFIYHLKIE